MPDEAPLTQEELDQRIADSPVGSDVYDAGVSRSANLLGAARQGFTQAIVPTVAGAARLVGDEAAAARLAGYQRDPNALGGGVLPVNPNMAEDLSTGIARGIGATPVLAAFGEGGLPVLVGTGALGGYDAYKQQLEDYNARAAAGQLAPGEQPPSPYKEIGKGAISNSAYLAGGGVGGALTRRALPSIEGPLARAATAYGGTVAGNLAGEQAARLLEGRPLGFDNPAQAGESAVAATVPFGFRPAAHLLSDKRAAYTPPKERAPSLPEVPNPVEVNPELSLVPLATATADATKAVAKTAAIPEAEVPAPPTTPISNETRNDTQQVNEPRQGDGPNGPVGQTDDAGNPLGRQVQGPVDQADHPAQQVRGPGELGSEGAQRPVLSPVPESPQTLIEQQKQLAAGTRPAVLFTPGEAVPETPPPGMRQITTDSGTYFYNPDLTDGNKILAADAAGRQNEILGLGTENKADVAAAPGTPVAVTERTPEGVEVKAAAASEAKAPETQAPLEEQKAPGNTVQVESPEEVLADRRNRTAIEGLHQTIGSLDEQIAQAQRTGFEEPTARRKPLPGPEAAAARDSLLELDAQRADASEQLIHFTPESAPAPPTLTEEAHNQRGTDLGALLDDAKAKLQAQNAVVDSMRPENARKGVDENGNTVEDIGGMSKEEREAYNEAKADAAGLRNAVRHLEQKLKEHGQSEPEPIGAPKTREEAIDEVARIKDVPVGPLKAYDQKFQQHFLPQWKAGLEKLWGQAVNITFSDTVETPSVRPLRAGGVEVLIPPDYAARVFAAHGREGGDARIAEVFREEGIHAVVIKALHDEWSKLDPATRPDFFEFNKQVTGKVAGEILATVQGLRDAGNHREAFAIEQAVRNAKELYDGAVGDSNSLTGRQILEQLARDPAGAYKYVHEMLRQFAQIRENGQITETTYQKIVGAITDLYHRALESLKGVADKAYSGEISKTMGDILRRVDEARKPQSKKVDVDIPVRPKTQVQGVTHLEDSVIPWHGLGNEDTDARAGSRQRPGYSPGAAAQDFLSDSHGNRPETLRPDQRNTVDLAKLAQFESGRGRLIDRGALLDGALEKAGGGEHEVFYDEKSDRWLKFVRPESSGITTDFFKTDYPLPDDVSRLTARAGTPLEYLDRIRLANEKFGDDQQYHGVWLDKSGEPGGIVISQPNIEGADATSAQIAKRLTEDGFKRVGPETWYRPTDNVIIDDTKPSNFVTNSKGVAQPVDIPIRVASPEVKAEAMRQINSGKRFLKAGERRDLPFAPRTLEEPAPIGAPKFIEKGFKSLAEKTKEARYLWGKQYRHFSDSFWRANANIDTNANNEGIRVTNSILVDIARAGGGKVPKIGEPNAELKANDAATVVLRQAGFGDVTSREEIDAARAKVIDWKARVDAGIQSPELAVREAMEHLKPAVDRAHELLTTDPDGMAKALAWAGKVGQETNRQLSGAAQGGFDVEGIDNYIRQVYEQDLSSKADEYVPSSAGRGGSSIDKGALKPRYYPDLVTAAEAGKKAVELSASKLVGQGEASLQKLLGQKQLTDELKTVTAPVTGRPVIRTEPDRVFNQELNNGRGGFVERAPEGYVAIDNPLGGKPIYAEKNVAPLFRLLTAASAVRASATGRLLLQIAAGIKHGTLLFDSYHLIRQAINLAALLAQGGNLKEIRRFVKQGLASLDIRPEDLDKYVREGAITEADAQYARDNQAIAKEATQAGVQFGKQLDNLYEQIGHPFWVSMLNHIPRGGTKGGGLGDYITDFNRYTFQKAARAAMIVGYKTARERNAKSHPDWTPEQIARQSAKEVNEIFGNMGKQGIFKSATAQDLARLFILAPQWNDGRMRFQGRAIGQLAKGGANLLRGKADLGNAGGVLLALAGGTLAANQVLNLATTGQPTWENPDGHKLDAFVPGGKNGFYYNPLSLAAEDIHTIQKYAANSSPLDVAKRIVLNKASGIGRAGAALAGIGPTGRPLPTDQSKVGQAAKSLLPIPIFASPAVSPYLQPELSQKGDFIRQAAGMAGIKLDRAESPEQRMRAIANKTFPQAFPKVESPGDYSRLRNFVANDKLSDAKSELEKLLLAGKTPEQIIKAFTPDRTFSSSRAQDALLMRKPEARELLQPARLDRMRDFQNLKMALARVSPEARQKAVIEAQKRKAGSQ